MRVAVMATNSEFWSGWESGLLPEIYVAATSTRCAEVRPDNIIYVAAAQHINFIFPWKYDSGTPKTLSSGKFQESLVFLGKDIVMPRRGRPWEFQGNRFWGLQMSILGQFSQADKTCQRWQVGHGGAICTDCSQTPPAPNRRYEIWPLPW